MTWCAIKKRSYVFIINPTSRVEFTISLADGSASSLVARYRVPATLYDSNVRLKKMRGVFYIFLYYPSSRHHLFYVSILTVTKYERHLFCNSSGCEPDVRVSIPVKEVDFFCLCTEWPSTNTATDLWRNGKIVFQSKSNVGFIFM